MIAVGLFMHEDPIAGLNNDEKGWFYGGDGSSLAAQLLACVCIIGWIGGCTLIITLVSEQCVR